MPRIKRLPNTNPHDSADYSNGGAGEDLPQCVPFQVNAAAHYGSGEEDGNAEPPRGIECKDVAVGQEGANDDSGAGRMHAHPVPHVGYHACALDKKAHH